MLETEPPGRIPSSLPPKPRVEGFRLGRSLGRGATAQVYEAARLSDGSRVALKILHPELSQNADSLRRFEREIRAVTKLEHPGIVRIHQSLLSPQDSEPAVLVLELVDGVSLEEFQTRLPYLVPELSVLIIREVLAALECAHERGVIHRDLKPSNILVSQDGQIKVTDFGLAKMSGASTATLTGTVLGSPDFMSPEQARGDVLTSSSDQFSVASILYFLITGTKPFAKENLLATLSAVMRNECEPVRSRNPKVSPALARILHRALSTQPRERYDNVREFRLALEGYLTRVGLGDLSLRDWVTDRTSSTTLAALKAMAEALVVQCQAELRSGQIDQAVDDLAHLEIVAPSSEALRDLLAELDRKTRRRGGAVLKRLPMLLTLLLGAGAGAGVIVWLQTAPQVATPPVASAPAALAPAIASAPEPVPAPVLAQKPLPSSNWVEFSVPRDTQVEWDGRVIDAAKRFRAKLGKHRLQMRKPGFPPISQEIIVDSEEPTVIRVK